MNAPIQAIYQSGVNLYVVLFNPVDGTVWNNSTVAWEAYNSAHWSQYAVAMTEYTGSGYYRVAYPITTPTVLSTDIIFVRAGGSPVLGDAPASSIYQSQGVNLAAAANSWTAGQNAGAAFGTQQRGSIDGTPASAVLLQTDLSNAQEDAYAGRAIIMTSGTLIQQAAFITAYDGDGLLTINGFPSGSTPADTNTFIVI